MNVHLLITKDTSSITKYTLIFLKMITHQKIKIIDVNFFLLSDWIPSDENHYSLTN